MPIYEYRCAACGHQFERYVASRSTAAACPSCQSPDVTRTLSVVTLRPGGGPAASVPSGGGCCGGGCRCH